LIYLHFPHIGVIHAETHSDTGSANAHRENPTVIVAFVIAM
jgi:hypothetical protein